MKKTWKKSHVLFEHFAFFWPCFFHRDPEPKPRLSKKWQKKFGANQKKRGFVHTPRGRFSRRYQTSKNISQVLELFCTWLVSTNFVDKMSTNVDKMSTKLLNFSQADEKILEVGKCRQNFNFEKKKIFFLPHLAVHRLFSLKTPTF